jgi:hypothetical protein
MEKDMRFLLIIVGICIVLVVGIAAYVGLFDVPVCEQNTELCQ